MQLYALFLSIIFQFKFHKKDTNMKTHCKFLSNLVFSPSVNHVIVIMIPNSYIFRASSSYHDYPLQVCRYDEPQRQSTPTPFTSTLLFYHACRRRRLCCCHDLYCHAHPCHTHQPRRRHGSSVSTLFWRLAGHCHSSR